MANEFTLKSKIIDMQRVADRMRVSVSFDDGKGEPWFQAFDIKYDRPISLEEFGAMLSSEEMRGKVKRPDDPYKYLLEAKDDHAEFVVKPQSE